MSEQIQNAIVAAVQEVNLTLPVHMQLSSDPEAVIFGKGGALDSLGLVNLVLAVEERLERAGVKISLTDERAMSQHRSPFRSIQSLTNFVAEVAKEQGRA